MLRERSKRVQQLEISGFLWLGMKGLGKGVKSFKDGMNESLNEKSEIDETLKK